ncbi:MAG: glycoside hydrolase family 43 protein [Desulfobacteraceae bacterium]|jgi:xylan 1,4-beta-xylosidase
MTKITNPILPGFNPDPSICRVGNTYYLAVSTFEWYPGVQIYSSTDLANWELIARPLDRKDQLDMRGNPDSCGIWAPCLSYCDNQFWLVYTDMKRYQGVFKDGFNYIVTAPHIKGPWSKSSFLNASGFDPSLFHDDDGRKWLVQMLWDYRSRPNNFAGIALQEFDTNTRSLIGERKIIFYGTDLKLTEGPHLYKRNGYYYLLTAEGGTEYDHACTLARSKNLEGPYELHPEKYILTAKDHPLHPIQRAGHGDIVDTPEGKTYLVHLMGRPITQKRRCVLGRETGIQEAQWRKDDWLWLTNGSLPSVEVDLPGSIDIRNQMKEKYYSFNTPKLPKDFQWLRTPQPERLFSLTENPGHLRLYGRESIGSWHEQSLVARRQIHFNYRAETELSFSPQDERQMAGLTAYYGRHAFYYAGVTAHSDGRREIMIICAVADNPTGQLQFPTRPVSIPNTGKVRLALRVEAGMLQFFYALKDSNGLLPIGPRLDATILSDEASGFCGDGRFTGAFVGMCAQDMNGTALPADFNYFSYAPLFA